jgi:hypothetical protein
MPPNFRIAHEDAKAAVLNKSTESIGLSSFIPFSGVQNPNCASPKIASSVQTGKPKSCELADVFVAASSPPFPLSSTEPVLPNEERGMKTGGRVTQGSSFLATAGLISETRFGVF